MNTYYLKTQNHRQTSHTKTNGNTQLLPFHSCPRYMLEISGIKQDLIQPIKSSLSENNLLNKK